VRIDHVLAGPAWRVTSARVPSLRLADHRPLLARLRWTTE
jgi:endonuclease/exonuclease/phosphatase (EEP) superfamily protein YafD